MEEKADTPLAGRPKMLLTGVGIIGASEGTFFPTLGEEREGKGKAFACHETNQNPDL